MNATSNDRGKLAQVGSNSRQIFVVHGGLSRGAPGSFLRLQLGVL